MKRLILLLFVAFTFATIGCDKEPDCRTCAGTVTNTGDMGDFTVCSEDGVLTQTNNISGDVMTSSNTLAESVAFFISIGLECDD